MQKLADSGITDVLFVVFLLVSCNVIKTLNPYLKSPFSLNGRWKLESTSDRPATLGSTIDVSASKSDAVRTNESSETRERVWKNISSSENGDSIRALDNSEPEYIPARITVVSGNRIRLSAITPAGLKFMQTWTRVEEP